MSGLAAESGEGKEITERRGEIFKELYLPTIKAFRDTRPLLEALSQRGMRLVVAMIGLRSGGWSERDLAGTLAVYASPADLLARLDDSPLGMRRAAGR